MRRPVFSRTRSKGAALVEYVVLMALIGVVLLTVVLRVGADITDTFAESTTTIQEETGVTPGDPDGGDPNVTDPPTQPPYVYPDPPIFPPPPPASGVDYVALSNQTIPYNPGMDSDFDFGFWIEYAFDEHYNRVTFNGFATPEEEAARDYDWTGNFTATDVAITSGDPDQYNQFEVTTTGLRIGADLAPPPGWPPVNWGRFYSGPECRATQPDPITAVVTGYNPEGDRAVVTFAFVPEDCPADFSFYRAFNLPQNSALIVDYGDLANALAAADGITGVDFNDVTSWTLLSLDRYDIGTGNEFNAVSVGSNVFSINAAVANEAYNVCNESVQMALQVEGVLPDGRAATLSINVNGGNGDGTDTCFVPFGGP
jgi:Flp pilus assembly pilin Flp